MCAVAIVLGDRKGLAKGAFIVQTPFGAPACIHHVKQGTGSCYPLSTKPVRRRLGSSCDNAGTNDNDIQEHFHTNLDNLNDWCADAPGSPAASVLIKQSQMFSQ
jgi:hypothetical protein